MKLNANNNTITLHQIKSVVALYNAKIIGDEELNTYIVIEDINDQQIILNITKGEEYINDKTKQIDYNKSIKTKKLYLNNYKNNIKNIEYGPTDTIMFYKNATIYNTINNKRSHTTDILEFKDINGNKIFIDIKFNDIYIKNIFDINEQRKTIKKLIYKPKIQTKITKNLFNHTLHDIGNLFFEYI